MGVVSALIMRSVFSGPGLLGSAFWSVEESTTAASPGHFSVPRGHVRVANVTRFCEDHIDFMPLSRKMSI